MVTHISSYGDSFADVYDDWYATISDVDATVEFLRMRTPRGGVVLELGSGTGRLAAPLAARGLHVVGLDASRAMLARRRRVRLLHTVEADMTRLPLAPRSMSIVFVAFNTLFNLQSHDAMRACLHDVARVLTNEGSFVVETFVPPVDGHADDHGVSLRSLGRDGAVLTSAVRRPEQQTIKGQHIEIRRDHLRLRPWSVTYATPAQLDTMAAAAGLGLSERHEGWRGEAFDAASSQHVSVYRRA